MKRIVAGLAVAFSLACWAGARAAEPASGQTVYVSVYSHLFHGNLNSAGKPESQLMSSMLSIRNVDPANGFRVTSVKYYDSDGKLLREMVKTPRAVLPLGTVEYFIEMRDRSGGSGANFLVTWEADKPIDPPIVETVHAYLHGNQSAVFVTPGRAIRQAGDR